MLRKKWGLISVARRASRQHSVVADMSAQQSCATLPISISNWGEGGVVICLHLLFARRKVLAYVAHEVHDLGPMSLYEHKLHAWLCRMGLDRIIEPPQVSPYTRITANKAAQIQDLCMVRCMVILTFQKSYPRRDTYQGLQVPEVMSAAIVQDVLSTQNASKQWSTSLGKTESDQWILIAQVPCSYVHSKRDDS